MSDTKLLVLDTPDHVAQGLGLRPGDTLVAINGVVFHGDLSDFKQRFSWGRRLALTFLRAGKYITVLSRTHDLGKWDHRAQDITLKDFTRIDPDYLSNWEVFRSADGLYDVQRLDRSLFALAAPPIWLLHMRMWRPLGAWVAMSLFAGIAGLWAVVAVQVFMGILFWKSGPDFVRADRRMRGLDPIGVVAARTEAGAHAEVSRLYPDLVWICAPTKPAIASHADA